MAEGLTALTGKEELRARLADLIGPEGVRKALDNPHSRRPPRPCGLTVHPGFGCPNGCLYCYVGDILGTGPTRPRPLELTGLELAYALASNPYFVPGLMGTFLAMGAVCDPFHPDLVGKTLDIMRAVASSLGNPTQFSTKMPIGPELAREIPRNLSVSPLITIITLERAGELEPKAPGPEERLKTISVLRKEGFKPMLFLRPLIPGLVEDELDDLISEAKHHGAVGVVIGALRVSRPILRRLSRLGLDGPIRARLKKEPPVGGLVPVPSRDLKEMAMRVAREKGLLVFKAACCANAYVAGVPCADLCWARGFCSNCPNDCLGKLPPVEEEAIREALLRAFGLRALGVHDEGLKLVVEVKAGQGIAGLLDEARKALEVATRRLVALRVVRP